MGLFQSFFVDVKKGTKITFSESDLRKLDRDYEKEILPDVPKRIRSPFRKVPQQAYLTQIRDYAFERILDKHIYTFQHLLVIPNPYDWVKQCALLLFNSSKETKIRYRVLGETAEADFAAETGYTKRHRVPVMGLYMGKSNQIELEMFDTEGRLVKRRMLRIYVSEMTKTLQKIEIEQQDTEQSDFPYVMLCGATYPPFAIDCNGDIRYSTQLKTTNVSMLPLTNGHFLYEDRTVNRMAQNGRIKSCRYHEMDYMGRVYRTFLLDYSIVGIVTKRENAVILKAATADGGRILLELNLESGELTERESVPEGWRRGAAENAISYINAKKKIRKRKTGNWKNCLYSKDRKKVLSCAAWRKKRRLKLVETDTETGEITIKCVVNQAAKRVWLFEPDILSLCEPVEVSQEVLFGTLLAPEEFLGELPPEVDESIERAYFSNCRLCDDLFLCAVLPGRVERIYFAGKNHVYVQDYAGMKIIGKGKFNFAIPLTELAVDEYSVLVESQEVVHRLKNEIRITEES